MLSTERGVLSGSDYYVYTPSTLATKLFLYPTCVGYFNYLPGYHLQRNSFDSFLLMHIRRGDCFIKTNHFSTHASSNQIVFINCYEPHAYSTFSGWEAEWLHFDGNNALEYYTAILNSGSPIITLKDSFRFEKNLHKIYLHFKESLPVKEAILNNYIVNMLTELLTRKESVHSENISSGIIEDTIAYINEHLGESLSLNKLSEYASLSPFYFSRLFKKETGFSPHEYIITTRINHAKFLLKSSNVSIKDICFSTGFSSESNFCTSFKKATGFTPSEYRFSLFREK